MHFIVPSSYFSLALPPHFPIGRSTICTSITRFANTLVRFFGLGRVTFQWPLQSDISCNNCDIPLQNTLHFDENNFGGNMIVLTGGLRARMRT